MKRIFFVILMTAISISALCAQQNEIVYVAGVLDGKATLWRNGVAQTLSNTSSLANSVFVVTQR